MSWPLSCITFLPAPFPCYSGLASFSFFCSSFVHAGTPSHFVVQFFIWLLTSHFGFGLLVTLLSLIMAQAPDVRPRRSAKHCTKCRQPVRGHTGPTGPPCRQPSPQFLNDIPELANIQQDIEASIQVHRDQIQNLTAEPELLNLASSTPVVVSSHSISSVSVPVVSNLHYSIAVSSYQAPCTVSWSSLPQKIQSFSRLLSHSGTETVAGSLGISAPVTTLASFSSSQNFGTHSQNKINEEHLVSLFRKFLQKIPVQQSQQGTSTSATMPGFPGDTQVMPTVVDFRQNPSLLSRADNMLSQLLQPLPAKVSQLVTWPFLHPLSLHSYGLINMLLS